MTQTRPEPKVIIIPAKEESLQDQEKKKNLRVAAYCRVSTKKDEQLGSYENQKAYYTEKIMANPNWTMADIFADEGITGTSACKRKDFLRMIRQCRKQCLKLLRLWAIPAVFWCVSLALSRWFVLWWKHLTMIHARSMLTKWSM